MVRRICAGKRKEHVHAGDNDRYWYVGQGKKAGLVRELTAKASEVTQIPAEKFIVLINEMERDNIGVGGKLLSEIL